MTALHAPPLPRPAPPAPAGTGAVAPPAADPTALLRRARYEPEPGDAVAHRSRSPRLPPMPPLEIITSAQAAAAHRALVPVLRMALEVLDGRRPAAHLVPHATATVQRYWRAAGGQRRVSAPARLDGLRVCLPAVDVAEVAAVCAMDGRVRALAARFERIDGQTWLWTAVRLG